VNIQTHQPAKPSSFVKAGGSTSAPALSWFEANRAQVIRLSVILVAVVLVVLAASLWYNSHSTQAGAAFSNAMDVYDAPLRQPGQPVDPISPSYATAADRGKAANPLFEQVANQYGFFKAGENARYFAGLTAEDMGQNGQAEADLKKAADSHDSGVASLAKMALASLYRKTSRQAQAISLYQDLIAHPTLTVPVSSGRLSLAETYEGTRPDEARKLYAQIKDQDKTSAAAQIAAQKLDGKK
jgi:tetratricopeptide (TPR) repeat protein